MTEDLPEIETPKDALVFCDYMATFAAGDVKRFHAGISRVIRELTHRLEQQALASEHAEARGGAA